ncbi:leucine-rich repeat domain-containing protein [Facilibium subflavum]|uniref:leucine-rich repeat domain-containing protein n=1 Tax=Facilibium subflavum TaxID=2219058 RepID=UPI000E64C732|nr:leucine-rich repeat domain-containing protein [Facilibium subflavum]
MGNIQNKPKIDSRNPKDIRIDMFKALIIDAQETGELNLFNLSLDSDDLQKLMLNIIEGSPNIKILNLEGNPDIKLLPTTIGQLKELEKLNLNDCKLKGLPDEIGHLTKLKRLQASNNKIENLPESVKNLTQLEKLELTKNKLSSLPIGIENLQSLITLTLAQNKFVSLPESIYQLQKLTYLYLSRNQLEALPNGISQLGKLRMLCLDDNQIRTLPDDIENLSASVFINLDDNPLAQQTVELINALNNEGLNIEYNMVAYEEPIQWQVVFDRLKPALGEVNMIQEIIAQDENLQDFISKAGASSLYQSNPEIIHKGLAYFLEKLTGDEAENVKEIIGLHSTDCATPVTDLCVQGYLQKSNEEKTPLPEGLITKLAVADYITKNKQYFCLKNNEEVEQLNGLLNVLFLKDAWLYQENKVKVKHDNDLFSWSNHIQFAFSQISNATKQSFIKAFLQVGDNNVPLKDNQGYYLIDQQKLDKITERYKANSLGYQPQEALSLLSKAYDTLINKLQIAQYTDFSASSVPIVDALFKDNIHKDYVIEQLRKQANISESDSVTEMHNKVESFLAQVDKELAEYTKKSSSNNNMTFFTSQVQSNMGNEKDTLGKNF